jgi:hypothetical protein
MRYAYGYASFLKIYPPFESELLIKRGTRYLTDMTVPLVIFLSSSGVNLKTA